MAIVEVDDREEAPTREKMFLQKIEDYASENYVADAARKEKAQYSGAPFKEKGYLWVHEKTFREYLMASRDRFFNDETDSRTLFSRCCATKVRQRIVRNGRTKRPWYYAFNVQVDAEVAKGA